MKLTKRQGDVKRELLLGKSMADIGKALNIEPATVKGHAHNVYKKLDVEGQLALIHKEHRESLK